MELALLIGVLFFLLIMGLPVAFALGIASLMTFYVLDIPLIVGFQRMAASMNIFALMAIPHSQHLLPIVLAISDTVIP